MAATTIPGLVGEAPTQNEELLTWIADAVGLFEPDEVRFADGSDEEWDRLANELVDAGTLIKLNEEKRPNSYLARSNPSDVARVESRTFICTEKEEDAGPTNNWADPAKMKAEMTEAYRGSMRGRTMYVVPFCMGPISDPEPKLGVQLTDSAYVVMSMRIMTRMGKEALDKIGPDGAFVHCYHSVGAPLEPSEEDVAWPCNDTKYITQFPETKEIWSYGSGYGGNAILAKKCYALRIASVMAKEEGWMAEHMLILKLTSPEGKSYHITGAFPSACGKTNLAMITPTLPGWKAEVVGDDIAWLKLRDDGLYAVNPENGFFGVAPGTDYHTNPIAMKSMEPGNTLYTNVALTDDGDVWWEGMDSTPEHLTDWKGCDWTPDGDDKAAHPNSRYCVPIKQCPVAAPEYDDWKGVKIDAILFGGRRPDTVPLVTQAHSWNHGTMIGALLASGQTAASAEAKVGALRHDPMAMLPFIGYNAGDYLQHWIDMGEKGGDRMPSIFLVNWFRRSDDGRFLWPGFGENSRVLKWIVDRIEGKVDAHDTVVGHTAKAEDLDLEGLDTPIEDVKESLTAPSEMWANDIPDNEAWLKKLGDRVPKEVFDEFEALKERIETARR